MWTKASLRQYIRECDRRELPQQKAEQSLKIRSLVEAMPAYRRAKRVLFYVSLADEPDTTAWLRDAAKEKEIFIPKCMPDGTLMMGSADCVATGSFGIPEPAGKLLPPEADVILVPGMAFSKEGLRLGRGRGYYDRMMKSCGSCTIGLAFTWKIVDNIPVDPWDVSVQWVVSADSLYGGTGKKLEG